MAFLPESARKLVEVGAKRRTEFGGNDTTNDRSFEWL